MVGAAVIGVTTHGLLRTIKPVPYPAPPASESTPTEEKKEN
jgi:hypothetical protein